MYDLGDTVNLTADCHNSAGSPANATTVTLTVTKPDGTTDTPSVTNPPSVVGKYTHPYVTTLPGRYVYRYTFTGAAPDQAWTDVFNVFPSAPNWIVGLGEVKRHLNIPTADTSADDELRAFVASVTEVIEGIVGAVARRQVTETVNGGSGHIRLTTIPVASVTQIVVDGTVIDAADYAVSSSGLITHRSGCWPAGLGNITVTYTAGRDQTPANVLDGTRDLIRINWRPQQGGNVNPFDGGRGDPFAPQGTMRLGFFVPNTVMQRLQSHAIGPIVF